MERESQGRNGREVERARFREALSEVRVGQLTVVFRLQEKLSLYNTITIAPLFVFNRSRRAEGQRTCLQQRMAMVAGVNVRARRRRKAADTIVGRNMNPLLCFRIFRDHHATCVCVHVAVFV